MTVAEILAEALAEDAREGSRFDADGFSSYFLEGCASEEVAEAWSLYEAYHIQPRYRSE